MRPASVVRRRSRGEGYEETQSGQPWRDHPCLGGGGVVNGCICLNWFAVTKQNPNGIRSTYGFPAYAAWRSGMPGPFVPLVVGVQILMVASNGPPTVDIRATCQTSINSVVSLGGTYTETLDACLQQQKAALQQIKNNWATY